MSVQSVIGADAPAGRTEQRKQSLEQYFTSTPISRFMASMMSYRQRAVHILDPGAGAGSLFTACVERICESRKVPERVEVTAYEIDDSLSRDIDEALDRAGRLCTRRGIKFSGRLIQGNFVTECAGSDPNGFTHVIMNPPYSKIGTRSPEYAAMMDRAGLRTTNMYTAFVSVAQDMLDRGGQMTFITPRSFCNGTYFRQFRGRMLDSMALRRIHLFDSRSSQFKTDGVLQENVIMCAKKGGRRVDVIVSSSAGPASPILSRKVRSGDVVSPTDPNLFVHIAPDARESAIVEKMRGLRATLDSLGLSVSTGKVVDFRAADALRSNGRGRAVPLVRPSDISAGTVRFPAGGKHPSFIEASEKTAKLLVRNGTYVLVKRFTAKEERRRIVAAVWTRKDYGTGLVGFENRVNYFYRPGNSIDRITAHGLWAFLNSTAADMYLRQFNGNTQVNATDLRYMRYPPLDILRAIGRAVGPGVGQDEIDRTVSRLALEGSP